MRATVQIRTTVMMPCEFCAADIAVNMVEMYGDCHECGGCVAIPPDEFNGAIRTRR